MTALLTDAEIQNEAMRHCDNASAVRVDDYMAGSFYARGLYEARLAEEAKVRAGLVSTLESISTVSWRNFDAELRDPQSFVDWARSIASAALAAAKVRG